jgi:Transglycosylase SLT domain
MKKVLLALMAFIIIGTYINRLDRSYNLYPAEPLVVVPEGQTTSSVLGAVQAAREASSTTAARSRARFENPKSKAAIEAYQEYLKDIVPEREELCYFNIIDKESNWNPLAQNPKSTAFGIGQFLNSTWGLVDYKKTKNPYDQIDAMVLYVKLIYGDGCNAWDFKKQRGWY